MLTYLNLGRNGRFGNQLFQIASTIGLATKNGYDYAFPKWINFADQKRFRRNLRMNRYFINDLPKLKYPESKFINQDIPNGYHDLQIEDNTSLNGYLQSPKYFEHCAFLIRHLFKLKTLSDLYLLPNSVAIHVRRADYDNHIFLHQGIDYYEKAIKHFPSNYNFYVFSDSPYEAKELLGDRFNFITGNHFMKDFYIIKSCEHFIISNSTFSWWAAWLSSNKDKEVIAPRKWFGGNVQIGGYNINSNDIYCKDWKVI